MPSKTSRKQRSPAEVLSLLRDFKDSGLTQTAFAKRIGVSRSAVVNWVRRYEIGATAAFTPIEISSPRASVTLTLGDLVLDLSHAELNTIIALVRGIAGVQE